MNPLSFFKSLSDETRLRCLLLIQQEGELCVCELTAALKEIQPKISRHLSQLKKAKLLEDRRQGQWVFYRIHPALPDWARGVLSTSADACESFLIPNRERLADMGDRPERTKSCC